MMINVEYQGKKHTWRWDTKEGRTNIPDASLKVVDSKY